MGTIRHDPGAPVGTIGWPATVPAVEQLLCEGLELPPGLTVLVGENGSGKSASWSGPPWPVADPFGHAGGNDVRMTSDVITLPDGRRVNWHDFGDPDGSPVIYTAGTLVSGLGGRLYDETARVAGLRWISPHKPGYGGSDCQRKRSLTSWADDLAALAGHLGLDRFALAGESGGGPFTLAAAHQLAGRVSVVALFAAACPGDPAGRAGMKASIRVLTWLARNAPGAQHRPDRGAAVATSGRAR